MKGDDRVADLVVRARPKQAAGDEPPDLEVVFALQVELLAPEPGERRRRYGPRRARGAQ